MSTSNYRFCPQCAGPLQSKHMGEMPRMACVAERCGFVHWDNPTPVVAAVVEHEGQIILARNKLWPVSFYALITGLIWVTAPVVTLVICLTPTTLLSKAFAKGEGGTIARYLAFIQRAGANRVRLETIGAIGLWALVWWSLGLAFAAVAICYAAFAFSWSSQQYIYHVRTPRHLIEGAYDLKLWAPLQALYLNFNYHLSHHRAPNVPWLYMRDVAQEEPTQSYGLTYLALWAPPQPVEQAWPVEHQVRGALMPRPEHGEVAPA